MNWLLVKDVKELEDLSIVNGKRNLNKMKKIINDDIKGYIKNHGYKEKSSLEIIKITSNSWSGLFDKICIFRSLIENFKFDSEVKRKVNLDNKKINYDDSEIDYFKSEEEELIFYILEMEGKKRSDKIGITRKCFMNKKEAQRWRNTISKKIHPDKSKNKNASIAASKINQLYKEMVQDE